MKKVSVECRNISLSYGSTEVLTDINLRIEPGEFFALLGPSGSGKSTCCVSSPASTGTAAASS